MSPEKPSKAETEKSSEQLMNPVDFMRLKKIISPDSRYHTKEYNKFCTFITKTRREIYKQGGPSINAKKSGRLWFYPISFLEQVYEKHYKGK